MGHFIFCVLHFTCLFITFGIGLFFTIPLHIIYCVLMKGTREKKPKGPAPLEVLKDEVTRGLLKMSEDLTPAKRTLWIFANEVLLEHPDWANKDVLKEAEMRTEKALGLEIKGIHTTHTSCDRFMPQGETASSEQYRHYIETLKEK